MSLYIHLSAIRLDARDCEAPKVDDLDKKSAKGEVHLKNFGHALMLGTNERANLPRN